MPILSLLAPVVSRCCVPCCCNMYKEAAFRCCSCYFDIMRVYQTDLIVVCWLDKQRGSAKNVKEYKNSPLSE